MDLPQSVCRILCGDFALKSVNNGGCLTDPRRDRPTAREACLREILSALAGSVDETPTLEIAVRSAAQLLDAPFARIWLLDEDGDLRTSTSYTGKVLPYGRRARLPGDSVAGLAARSGRVLMVADVTQHSSWRDPDFTAHSGLHAYLGAPVRRAGLQLGVLEVMRPLGVSFAPADRSRLLDLANSVAVAVHNARIVSALRQREREFSALVEYAPDVIARIDREARFVYVNPAVERVAGLAAELVRGKTLAELGTAPSAAAAWAICVQQVFETGHEVTADFPIAMASGVRMLQARLAPELAADGSIEHVLCIARDAPDRVRTAEAHEDLLRELLDQQRRLERLTERVLVLRGESVSRLPEHILPSLTQREADVLRYLVLGMSNPEIGRELNLSTATIKSHMTTLLAKLQAGDRTQAAVRAVSLGLASAVPYTI